MKCKNRFCVFNRTPDICLNKNVVLNECGFCERFFYPSYLKGLSNSEKENFIKPPNNQFGQIYKNENKKYHDSIIKKGLKSSAF